MSRGALSTLTFLAALGTGLMAGLFFAFSVSVMRALSRIPPPAGIAAMQAINVVILNPLFGLVFFGTVLACAVLAGSALVSWHEPASPYLLSGGLLYLVGSFLVTLVFNVPRNNALAKLDSGSGGASSDWSRYVSEWTFWNHVRMVAALASMGCLIIGFDLLRDP
jgi:uncharacterized membrane protein